MKLWLLIGLAIVGCGQATAEPKASGNSKDVLHWLGKEWTNPKIYREGTLFYYRRPEWPGVQVVMTKNSADDYAIHTECWENAEQDWAFHGPDMSVRPTEVVWTLWSHGDPAGANAVISVPWNNAGVRVDDPETYELAEP